MPNVVPRRRVRSLTRSSAAWRDAPMMTTSVAGGKASTNRRPASSRSAVEADATIWIIVKALLVVFAALGRRSGLGTLDWSLVACPSSDLLEQTLHQKPP